ncbi:sensor histidine kinase [Thermodesulfobacteriota bacterium]
MSDNVKKPQFTVLYILKIALTYFLPLAILISIIIGIFYYNEITTKKNIIKIDAVNKINMQIAKIRINFKHIVCDLLFFASYNQTIGVFGDLENPDEQKRKLSEDISLFIRGSKIYDQIRILDSTGMEFVRVDFKNSKPVIVPKERLQFKGSRYYFMDSFALNNGEVFLSPFDLNIEHGLIEKPLKPMLRFGTPVNDRKGEKKGVLIFNYLGANLINEFKSIAADSAGFHMFLDSMGYWIVGRNPEEEWGFMFEDRKNRTMGNDFSEAWQKISSSNSGQFYTGDGLFTFTTFYPLLEEWKSSTGSGTAFTFSEKMIKADEYSWKIVSYIPDEYFIQENNKSFGKYILLGIAIIFVIGIMTWFLAQAVARRRHAESELRKRNKKLTELNELKNKFVGIAAHDLRNPLISIRGFSEVILSDELSAVSKEQNEFLKIINTTSQEMLTLVNDLLDISTIESGKLDLNLKPGSLKNLIEERLRLNIAVAEMKKMTFHSDLSDIPDFPFDSNRISQVVDNLISNAVKYSPSGSSIFLKLEEENQCAKFGVRDEGPGISTEDQKKLFGEFQRLSSQPTGGEKSTGLGLSITKKFVEAHGGTIIVQSELSVGSTFSILLPIKAA